MPTALSSTNDSRKLSKKQKKAIAFRERNKPGKGKSKADDGIDDDLDNVVPVSENQDLAEIQMGQMENERDDEPSTSKDVLPTRQRKSDKEAERPDVPKTSKKRRLDDVEAGDSAPKPTKRAKKPTGQPESSVDKDSSASSKQRLILFVGNLKYTTSLDSIRDHFAACEPPPTIRLLTPKAIPGKTTTKSKGCAFLEFSHKSGLQQALKLHQSTLDGRRINVELTAGGGGKGEQRLTKLRERNKELTQQRKKRVESSKGNVETTVHLDPQRYSSTAGGDMKPTTMRTWTVGDTVEQQTQRGGKKHSRQRKSKHLGTGVNAIPVG